MLSSMKSIFAKKTDYSTRIVEDENEILDITDLVTTPALNAKSYRI